MTKAELVSQTARAIGYDKKTIQNVLDGVLTTIKGSISNGENVYLRGFGTFVVKVRREKIARDIVKKTSMVVPEHKIAAFKPGRDFAKDVRTAKK